MLTLWPKDGLLLDIAWCISHTGEGVLGPCLTTLVVSNCGPAGFFCTTPAVYHDKTAFPRTIVRVEWCCNPHAPFVHCVPFLVSSTQGAKNPCTDRNPWACCCCGHKQCLSRYGGYWRVKRVHPPTVLACSGSKTRGIAGRGGESG